MTTLGVYLCSVWLPHNYNNKQLFNNTQWTPPLSERGARSGGGSSVIYINWKIITGKSLADGICFSILCLCFHLFVNFSVSSSFQSAKKCWINGVNDQENMVVIYDFHLIFLHIHLSIENNEFFFCFTFVNIDLTAYRIQVNYLLFIFNTSFFSSLWQSKMWSTKTPMQIIISSIQYWVSTFLFSNFRLTKYTASHKAHNIINVDCNRFHVQSKWSVL